MGREKKENAVIIAFVLVAIFAIGGAVVLTLPGASTMVEDFFDNFTTPQNLDKLAKFFYKHPNRQEQQQVMKNYLDLKYNTSVINGHKKYEWEVRDSLNKDMLERLKAPMQINAFATFYQGCARQGFIEKANEKAQKILKDELIRRLEEIKKKPAQYDPNTTLELQVVKLLEDFSTEYPTTFFPNLEFFKKDFLAMFSKEEQAAILSQMSESQSEYVKLILAYINVNKKRDAENRKQFINAVVSTFRQLEPGKENTYVSLYWLEQMIDKNRKDLGNWGVKKLLELAVDLFENYDCTTSDLHLACIFNGVVLIDLSPEKIEKFNPFLNSYREHFPNLSKDMWTASHYIHYLAISLMARAADSRMLNEQLHNHPEFYSDKHAFFMIMARYDKAELYTDIITYNCGLLTEQDLHFPSGLGRGEGMTAKTEKACQTIKDPQLRAAIYAVTGTLHVSDKPYTSNLTHVGYFSVEFEAKKLKELIAGGLYDKVKDNQLKLNMLTTLYRHAERSIRGSLAQDYCKVALEGENISILLAGDRTLQSTLGEYCAQLARKNNVNEINRILDTVCSNVKTAEEKQAAATIFELYIFRMYNAFIDNRMFTKCATICSQLTRIVEKYPDYINEDGTYSSVVSYLDLYCRLSGEKLDLAALEKYPKFRPISMPAHEAESVVHAMCRKKKDPKEKAVIANKMINLLYDQAFVSRYQISDSDLQRLLDQSNKIIKEAK